MVTMARQRDSHAGAAGRLSFGPSAEDGIVPQTLAFIRRELPAWRDDPKRPRDDSEKRLNSSLCDYLDRRSRADLPMARFKHESPQLRTRTVDIGVHGIDETTLIGVRPYSSYEPFLVIEAKRLPAPGGKDREREYVTGTDRSSGGPTGGIQRFKLGLHGSDVETAAMVGYIEKHSPNHWHGTINRWITDLMGITSTDGCVWSKSDILQSLQVNDSNRTAFSISNHQRPHQCVTPEIVLHHLWIVMES
jgi:hypothetical protein